MLSRTQLDRRGRVLRWKPYRTINSSSLTRYVECDCQTACGIREFEIDESKKQGPVLSCVLLLLLKVHVLWKLGPLENILPIQGQDAALAAAVTRSGPLSRRKKEKKPLRCQTILAAAHKARPVNQAASRKGKLKGSVVKPAAKSLTERAVGSTDEGSEKSSLDLWEDQNCS